MNKFKRGSEWRKWDLHVHAPSRYTCSKKDDYVGSSLEEKQNIFIEELKLLGDISVLGITDYFSLDAYKKVIEFKDQLGNIDLILPNLELRITPETNDLKKINLHIIFNTEVLSIDKIERFLHKFEFQQQRINFTCNEDDLIALGKTFDVTYSDEAAFTKGLNEFSITYQKFFEVLKQQDETFLNNIMIGVSNNSGDGASGIKDLSGIRNVIYEGVDFIFSAQPNDREYFLGKGVDDVDKILEKYNGLKPCIHGSDYHGGKSGKKICIPDLNRFCWVKADPTFEGLKQIVYEPEYRVKIQESKPEEKTGYQVMKKITINHDDIYNTELELNPNLNTIVGGRSTGKSILLAAIAKKLKIENPPKFHNKEYEDYIIDISDSLSISWEDGKEDNSREVEYFKQGYMYDLARDKTGLSNLIQNILRKKGKDKILDEYLSTINENKKKISAYVDNFFQILDEIKIKENSVSDKGDKEGIESEIAKLSDELNKLNTEKVTETESKEYEENKLIIEEGNKKLVVLEKDKEKLEYLKELNLVQDSIEYELTSVSDFNKNIISEKFRELKGGFEKDWSKEIDSLKEQISTEEKEIKKQIKVSQDNKTYIKVFALFTQSEHLKEIEEKIKKEKEKLLIITTLLDEIEKLTTQKDKLKQQIITLHGEYLLEIDKLVPLLSDSVNGLEIKAKKIFKEDGCKDFLESAMNKTFVTNHKYLYSGETLENKIISVFEDLVEDKSELKAGYTNKTLANRLLSENFYRIEYDLIYENDDFNKMSDGKKSFVVLILLLDFSDKDCPILIDQPEDDLDNRSIYNDLVFYLKNKKKFRQIIVATHNPNVVVSADSECVIVTNQHGVKNKNSDSKKFEYVQGSLENSFPENGDDLILHYIGIQEHVCDILEGGEKAFEQRRRKYNI